MNREELSKKVFSTMMLIKRASAKEISDVVVNEALHNDKLRERNTKIVFRLGKKVQALDNAFDFIIESKRLTDEKKVFLENVGRSQMLIKEITENRETFEKTVDAIQRTAGNYKVEIDDKFIYDECTQMIVRAVFRTSLSKTDYNFMMYANDEKTTVLQMLTTMKNNEDIKYETNGDENFEKMLNDSENDSKN